MNLSNSFYIANNRFVFIDLWATKKETLKIERLLKRRGRDSNPRYSFPHNSFRDCHNRPLCHLSVGAPRVGAGGALVVRDPFEQRDAKINLLGEKS